jgi:hypothetical protein
VPNSQKRCVAAADCKKKLKQRLTSAVALTSSDGVLQNARNNGLDWNEDQTPHPVDVTVRMMSSYEFDVFIYSSVVKVAN